MMAGIIHQQFAEFPAFTNAPYFFRLQALFPYIQGMGFMQAALRRGGWEGLEPIFADPPTTTKAIYEPDLYFENQALPQVALPRPPALERTQGLRVLSENSFGQLGYYALLGQFISEAEAKTVAPNWLADRFIVYENESDGGLALIARTRWDGSEQALTFFRAYHMILTKKYPELTTDRRSGPDSFVGTASNGSVILLRRGDECLWAEGIPAPQTRAMLDWLRTS